MTMPVFLSNVNSLDELEAGEHDGTEATAETMLVFDFSQPTRQDANAQMVRTELVERLNAVNRIVEQAARLKEAEETKRMLADTNEELGQQLLAAEARAEAAETALADRIEHCEKHHSTADAGRLRGIAEELRGSLEYALRATGCDGDLCMEDWHEDARKVLALTAAALSPTEQADDEKGVK